MATELVSVRVVVYGRVQGVNFRAFTANEARILGLVGYVRNLREFRAVEVKAEGERDNLEKLIDLLKIGPPAARVEKVETEWDDYSGKYSGFQISY